MATWGPLARPSVSVWVPAWARLTTRARLGLACLLSILPLGLQWKTGAVMAGSWGYRSGCINGLYSWQWDPTGAQGGGVVLAPADPSSLYPSCQVASVPLQLQQSALGYQEPVRLFFVVAALLFGYAAFARRTALTRRLAGIGVAATVAAAVLAVSVVATDGTNRAAALCTALALVLAVPSVWSRRGQRATVSDMTMPPPGGYPDPQRQPPGSYPAQGGHPPRDSAPTQGAYPQPGAYPPGAQMPYAMPTSRRSGGAMAGVVTLALVGVVAVVVGLSLKENGTTGWQSVRAWGGLAVLGGLATLAPALGGSMMSPHRAWQVAACGAGALGLFWVLFVLPAVGSNTSLIVTIGTAAGVAAAWVAPGRTTETESGPQHHTW